MTWFSSHESGFSQYIDRDEGAEPYSVVSPTGLAKNLWHDFSGAQLRLKVCEWRELSISKTASLHASRAEHTIFNVWDCDGSFLIIAF